MGKQSSKAAPLARKARLDAIGAAWELIASGKAGSARNGAKVRVGELSGKATSGWWNWVYRARYSDTEARRYQSTIIGRMPLVIESGITYIVLTGEEVSAVRDAWNGKQS